MLPRAQDPCGVHAAIPGSADPRRSPRAEHRAAGVLGIRRGLGACLGWVAVSGFVLEGHAFAIPSPDVVVNLFASAAQVLGLLTVIFGKWFFGGSRKAGSSGRPS